MSTTDTDTGYLARDLGTALTDARKRAGLSQRGQAKALDMAPISLRELELGLANPTLARVEQVAGTLGYDVRLELVARPEVEADDE